MTAVATPAGAVSHNAVDWHAINWHKAHTLVRRLQARIVQATQAGRWGKVQALQRLLTHSLKWLYSSGYTETRVSFNVRGVYDEYLNDAKVSR
jgi:reverse transcriptase-like protein